MIDLAPGTLCWLVNVEKMPELLGRVVEVSAGPMFVPDDGDGERWFYAIEASWIREQFPAGMISPRKQLLPIIPPGLSNKSKVRAEA